MSILRNSPTPPNQAVAFLIECSSSLLSDPAAERQIDALRQCGATDDEIGAKMGALATLRMAQSLPSSGASLALDAQTTSFPEAQLRSLSTLLGPEAAAIIFNDDRFSKMAPREARSSLQLWRFSDGSFIFNSHTPDPAFGEFCSAWLSCPEIIDAWDQKHRASHGGEPLSRAALMYARSSLADERQACFPIPPAGLEALFFDQVDENGEWLSGYRLVHALSGEALSFDQVKALARKTVDA